MARDSLTAFYHTERNDCIISLYKGRFSTCINPKYLGAYYFTDGVIFVDEEVLIGPKVIVEWSK